MLEAENEFSAQLREQKKTRSYECELMITKYRMCCYCLGKNGNIIYG